MKPELYQKMIKEYIDAYNAFDINGMLKNLHREIQFENIVNGEVTLSISGISDFRDHAARNAEYFITREQKIKNIDILPYEIRINLDFRAILKKDFPDRYKAGDRMDFQGKSVFTFKDGRIAKIVVKS